MLLKPTASSPNLRRRHHPLAASSVLSFRSHFGLTHSAASRDASTERRDDGSEEEEEEEEEEYYVPKQRRTRKRSLVHRFINALGKMPTFC
ncbi:unnamed protein product [Tilletia controversa]|nr:unnamed protein product [Tilletia controversa]CAD6967344.1 unnamed protein product [Tilletia controversa]